MSPPEKPVVSETLEDSRFFRIDSIWNFGMGADPPIPHDIQRSCEGLIVRAKWRERILNTRGDLVLEPIRK